MITLEEKEAIKDIFDRPSGSVRIFKSLIDRLESDIQKEIIGVAANDGNTNYSIGRLSAISFIKDMINT